MEEKKRNNRITIALIGIFVILSFLVGVTYAYFAATAQSDTVTITSGRLEIVFTDGQLINATNIEPINESDILTKATKKSFSVAKASDSNDMYARIDLTDLVVSNNFQDYDLKWALYEGSTKITTGSFVTTSDGSDSINMATNVLINSTTPKNYSLYIWIQETGVDQTNLVDGSLTGKITVTGEKNKLNTLASKILSEIPQTNPTFSTTSTDKGLFVQKDDSTKSNYGFPTYYFRGSVENNYVSFSGENFRIVRINEDGTIRLVGPMVYPDAWDDSSECMNNGECNLNFIGSNVEKEVKNWYSNYNLDSNDLVIQNSEYCQKEYSDFYSFYCPRNSVIIDKVALLSADEVGYSGALYEPDEMINSLTYLSSEYGDLWWTMTKNTPNGYIIWFWNNYLSTDSPMVDNSAMPVINLKPDVLVASGNGTESSPYVIE